MESWVFKNPGIGMEIMSAQDKTTAKGHVTFSCMYERTQRRIKIMFNILIVCVFR